jgi:hypothetical protein
VGALESRWLTARPHLHRETQRLLQALETLPGAAQGQIHGSGFLTLVPRAEAEPHPPAGEHIQRRDRFEQHRRWTNVTGLTMAPSRIRSVRAARNPSVAYASSISASALLVGSACSRWSLTHIVSSPACSAHCATFTSSVPSRAAGPGQE